MEHIAKTWDSSSCQLAFEKARLLDTTLTMEKFTVYLSRVSSETRSLHSWCRAGEYPVPH